MDWYNVSLRIEEKWAKYFFWIENKKVRKLKTSQKTFKKMYKKFWIKIKIFQKKNLKGVLFKNYVKLKSDFYTTFFAFFTSFLQDNMLSKFFDLPIKKWHNLQTTPSKIFKKFPSFFHLHKHFHSYGPKKHFIALFDLHHLRNISKRTWKMCKDIFMWRMS